MEISKKTIEQLLEPFGFTIRYEFNDNWMSIRYNAYIIYLDSVMYFTTYDMLFDALMKSKQFIYIKTCENFDVKLIDNPYFNCKSLEEMFIIRDLMLK